MASKIRSNINPDDDRPDPDTLLEAITEKEKKGSRGKLKIFLGASPGVGKTYAMLEAAHKAKENGIKVVVGVVVTHGRAETEELLDGLELFPLKKINYREKDFFELNTHKIIKDRPQLVLVDELAHRNTPGSINEKRYQDILNILDAGIDVYTAVNIQHLESLKDEVFQITKIPVKESVPDFIFEEADETVVIDITPSELIERLNEGKVYIPEEASRAVSHYFSETNISALRAFALQIAAKSISKRVIIYKQTQGIKEPWSISQKVLVCISDSSFTPGLIRSAKKLADQVNGDLTAVYVDTPLRTLSSESKKRILNYKRYAEYMGAGVVTITSASVSKSIIKFSRENNITHIVLSKGIQTRLADFVLGSVVGDVIRYSGKINIHMLNERPKIDSTSVIKRLFFKYFFPKSPAFSKYFLITIAITILALIITGFLKHVHIMDNITVMMILLMVVAYTAYRYTFYNALISALICCFAFGFVFEEPYFTFDMSKFTVVLTLIVFLIVSYMISRLTYILRQQVSRTLVRERTTNLLYQLTKKITDLTDINILYTTTTESLHAIFGYETVLFIEENNELNIASQTEKAQTMDTKAKAALNWTWKYGKQSGAGTDTLNSCEWFFFPLEVGEQKIGVLSSHVVEHRSLFSPDKFDFFHSIADQSAVAINRLQLLSRKSNK